MRKRIFLCCLTLWTPFWTIVVLVPRVHLKIIMKNHKIIIKKLPIRQCYLVYEARQYNQYTWQSHIDPLHIQYHFLVFPKVLEFYQRLIDIARNLFQLNQQQEIELSNRPCQMGFYNAEILLVFQIAVTIWRQIPQ